jgi:hypothetical protein
MKSQKTTPKATSTEATSSEGAKYRRIIAAAEARLSAQSRKRQRHDSNPDEVDEDFIGEFYDEGQAEFAIRRHRSFLPFVEAGLLPAAIAIRMAVEGKSAVDEVDGR